MVVTRHGGPEVLQMVEEDLPEPAAGEVRVRVQTAGVSAYDLMQRRSGSLPGTPQVPYVQPRAGVEPGSHHKPPPELHRE